MNRPLRKKILTKHLFHDWNGCKCTVCGKTREEGHDWNGCKCTICGKTRHDLDKNCICRICGTTDHHWILDSTNTFYEEGEEIAMLPGYHGIENMGLYVSIEYKKYTYRCQKCGKTYSKTEKIREII